MSKSWTVNSRQLIAARAQVLASLESVLAAQGEDVSRDEQSYVRRVMLDDKTIYIKCYTRLSGGLIARFLPTRAKTEWQNLQLFQKLGINTPELLAYGEDKSLSHYAGSALVTAAVEESADLEDLSINRPELFKDRQWVEQVFEQVMDFLRRLHAHRFAHNDLNWRNILVKPASGDVFFFDCPRGRRWLPPLLGFRKRKDLAHLDKMAPDCLSATQRLRFYKKYAGISKLRPADKKNIRWIVERTRQSRQKKQGLG